MSTRFRAGSITGALLLSGGLQYAVVSAQQPPPSLRPTPDPALEAVTPREVPRTRPEQRKGEQDRPEKFLPANAPVSSPVLKQQPEQGEIRGFDFARDPLNAKKPMETFEENMAADVAARPGVMAAQRRLLETRYDLALRSDPAIVMSRGKPQPLGPVF
jgi:hypothetical protein